MSQRTTQTKVENILGSHYDGSTDLQPSIDTAVAMVDYISSQDSAGQLTASLKERIECYLAAHYYAHADQIKKQEKRGKSSASYQGSTGKGFNSTQYGQSALELDVTGTLASTPRKKAQAAWLGLAPSNQTDYVDRD